MKRSLALTVGFLFLLMPPALQAQKKSKLDLSLRYLLLATKKTSTMQKEMREAADQGFRLLPSTLIQKKQMFGRIEIVMIMEKAPGGETRYQYLLLATTRTSTLQKEMREATEQGYEVVGMVSRGEHIVILEKAVAQ